MKIFQIIFNAKKATKVVLYVSGHLIRSGYFGAQVGKTGMNTKYNIKIT